MHLKTVPAIWTKESVCRDCFCVTGKIRGIRLDVAENKSEFPDYGDRNGNRAKNGWYLYDILRTKKEASNPLE